MESNPPTFWTPEAIARAVACAHAWHGTPHRDRMAVPGVGIDCLYFVRECLVAGGVLPMWQFPYYRPSWGVGREFNVMERVFLKCCNARKLDDGEAWQDGDVLVFNVGRQSNHVGIFLAGQIWHSMAARGVEPADANEAMVAAMQCVLRVTGEGFNFRPEELTLEDFSV